ncbi:MAG: alanine racemase [Proteobacteria bacterium]|nr:alanine racemase [Pseudomonadota bacterium]MDA1290939.1 alanine racemase [Pseudomonadota bacterium]
MIDSSFRAWATIDLRALKKNLSQVSIHCPESQIVPVIKANAFGHGVEKVALALNAMHKKFAAFAVASMEEAMELRTLGISTPILLLSGFRNKVEMDLCLNHKIEPVIHSMYQFEEIDKYLQTEILSGVGRVWLKFNSGMNRLGLDKEQALRVYGDLHKHPETEVVLMSHLASADETENQSAVEFTQRQIAEFDSLKQQIANSTQGPVQASLAASAGILSLPQTHHQFVRPGFMLYGGSPFTNRTAQEIGLLPVMTLRARIIAINDVEAGGTIGYGATHRCEQTTRVGIVSIGYADGYPRSAKNGTPVLVNTKQGQRRAGLLGRVSMDTIAIDLTGLDTVKIGDDVVLFGDGLSADEVARYADTVSYELFCKVTKRVEFVYTDG